MGKILDFMLSRRRDKAAARLFFSLVIALLATFSTPAMANDTAKANQLFVTAITDWQAAADLAGNNRTTAEQRVKLLQGVINSLEPIVDKRAGSDLAMKLSIGEQIEPLS